MCLSSCVRVCVCVSVCTCPYACAYVTAYVSMCVRLRGYVHAFMSAHLCLRLCMSGRTVCISICMHALTCVAPALGPLRPPGARGRWPCRTPNCGVGTARASGWRPARWPTSPGCPADGPSPLPPLRPSRRGLLPPCSLSLETGEVYCIEGLWDPGWSRGHTSTSR